MSSTTSRFSAINYCRGTIENCDPVLAKVRLCPTIASLKSVNEALGKLTAQSQSPVNEIAEVISRDLSLTARLLRLVNSVFGGLSVKITSIEEAIFFLGLRQIRQLTMTTRVIDEMEKFETEGMEVDWKKIWRHSIGSGILTREILSMTQGIMEDDTYYICGLLHDIGKLVMLSIFPEELKASMAFEGSSAGEIARKEKAAFGWDHAEIGAMYLEVHGLPREIVASVLFHHDPEAAVQQNLHAAGIQVADSIARYGGCEQIFEPQVKVDYGEWEGLSGWQHLFSREGMEGQYARASVLSSIERLPSILQGLL